MHDKTSAIERVAVAFTLLILSRDTIEFLRARTGKGSKIWFS